MSKDYSKDWKVCTTKAAQVGASIITTPLKALGLTSPIGVAIEGAVEGGIYD